MDSLPLHLGLSFELLGKADTKDSMRRAHCLSRIVSDVTVAGSYFIELVQNSEARVEHSSKLLCRLHYVTLSSLGETVENELVFSLEMTEGTKKTKQNILQFMHVSRGLLSSACEGGI